MKRRRCVQRFAHWQVPPPTYYASLLDAPTVCAVDVGAYNVTAGGAITAITAAYSSNATHALPIAVASALSALLSSVASAQGLNGASARFAAGQPPALASDLVQRRTAPCE